MKKLFLFIVFFFLMDSLFGDDRFFNGRGVDAFTVNYELYVSANARIENGFSISFVGFYFENLKYGIGFEFILPQYNFYFNRHSISLLNLKAYWNIFAFLDNYNFFTGSAIFGPCISINYFNWYLPDELKTNNIIYSAGFKYTLRISIDSEDNEFFFAPIINIEGGYKNINGLNNVYFSVKIGFGSLPVFFRDVTYTGMLNYKKK